MPLSCHKQIEKRISRLPAGSVFAITDFTDISEPKTVSKVLGRLCDSGLVEKIFRGVFWKPNLSQPSANELAQAIARSNNWTALPCGDSALNIFGINNDKKIKLWTYITDGTYRSYSYNDIVISFKHGAEKIIKSLSKETLLVSQTIKACGKNLSQEEVKKIREKFSPKQITKILKETKYLAAWVGTIIRHIFAAEAAKETR